MTEPDEPFCERALLATITVQIECPVCNITLPDPLELAEHIVTGHWSVPPEDRFQKCPECDALLDAGGISLGVCRDPSRT